MWVIMGSRQLTYLFKVISTEDYYYIINNTKTY